MMVMLGRTNHHNVESFEIQAKKTKEGCHIKTTGLDLLSTWCQTVFTKSL